MPATLTAETRYRLLKYLADHPETSQRELARELHVSVGKVNYCLRALITKGWVKARNFRDSRNKAGYFYFLTPKGFEEKMNVTSAFLRRKLDEYDEIREEIDRLTREVSELASGAGADEPA